MIQHLLKSIDCLSYHLRMKTIEHLFQSIIYQDFIVLIDGKRFFDMQKNKEETYEQIIEMGRNNDCTTGNLLDFEYFSKHYKLITIDLSKQIELENSDLKQQFNFIGRLERNEGATKFFITEKSEETTFEFLQNAATVV